MKTKKICLILLCTLSTTTIVASHRRRGGGSSRRDDATAHSGSSLGTFLAAATSGRGSGRRAPASASPIAAASGAAHGGSFGGAPSHDMVDTAVGTGPDYDSDSERPIEFTGALAGIEGVHGGYVPGRLSSWAFPGVLDAATGDEEIDARAAAKAGSELLANPERFSALNGALIAQALRDGKVGMEPAYFGDYSAACRIAKQEKAEKIVERLRADLEELGLLKAGEVAALEGYGRMSGTGRTSPVGEYGKGTQYEDDEVASAQRAIAKAFAITNARQAARDAIVASEKKAVEDAAAREEAAKAAAAELASRTDSSGATSGAGTDDTTASDSKDAE